MTCVCVCVCEQDQNLNPNVLEHYLHTTTGSPTIVYGAASKGIIKRDQQNNAIVYKTYYAASNPFQHMDPVELEKYKKEVAEKQIKQQGLSISLSLSLSLLSPSYTHNFITSLLVHIHKTLFFFIIIPICLLSVIVILLFFLYSSKKR